VKSKSASRRQKTSAENPENTTVGKNPTGIDDHNHSSGPELVIISISKHQRYEAAYQTTTLIRPCSHHPAYFLP